MKGDKPDIHEDEHDRSLDRMFLGKDPIREHQKACEKIIAPPPGFAEPVRTVQKAAGGWLYIEEKCSQSGQDGQAETFWRVVAYREGTTISAEIDHPDLEVARSAAYRAAEILEREVPV